MTDDELAFQQQKWAEERQLREAELDQKRAERRSPWTSPIIVAVIAARTWSDTTRSLPAGRKDDPGPALPLERFKAMVARR